MNLSPATLMTTLYWSSVAFLLLNFGLNLLFYKEDWTDDELCSFVFVTFTPVLNTVAVLVLTYRTLKHYFPWLP